MSRSIFLISFSLMIFISIYFLKTSIDKEASTGKLLAAPPLDVKYFTFGFSDIFADSLWLRFIQDIDKCSVLQNRAMSREICERGWGFQMLNVMTDVAPRFRMPHVTGPLSISVLNDDYEGAEILFAKAIKQFPNDWPILYRAAYHYLEDRPDPMKAAELLARAGQMGAPEWVKSLAARMFSEMGQKEVAIQLLQSYLTETEDEKLREEINKRIQKLKSP